MPKTDEGMIEKMLRTHTGQSKIDIPRMYAMKNIYITKTTRGWGPTKSTTPYCLQVSKTFLNVRKHYVFRYDVNEVYEQASCFKIAAFSTAQLAYEFLLNGSVLCSAGESCSHSDYECRQRAPKIVDKSTLWEVGYFVISNKQLHFNPRTYHYAAASAISKPSAAHRDVSTEALRTAES